MPCYSASGLLHMRRVFFLHRVHSLPVPSQGSFSCSELSFSLLPLKTFCITDGTLIGFAGDIYNHLLKFKLPQKNGFQETGIQVWAARSGSLIAPPQHMLSLPPLGFARTVTLLLWPVLEHWTCLSSLPATSWLLSFPFLSGPLSSSFF